FLWIVGNRASYVFYFFLQRDYVVFCNMGAGHPMKLLCICILFVFSLAGWANPAEAQAAYIRCVKSTNVTACSGDGFDANDYFDPPNNYVFVYARGYNKPGDGGGGTFAYTGVTGSTTCT